MIKLLITGLASSLLALPVFAMTQAELIRLTDITEKVAALMCYVSINYPQSSGAAKGKYVQDAVNELYGRDLLFEYVNTPYSTKRLEILAAYLDENCAEAFMESNWD